MNKFFKIILIVFLFFYVSSCSKDDYYTGDEAKNALKHSWSVDAIRISSTNPALDEIPNYALKTFILNTSVFTKEFDGQHAITNINAKHTEGSFTFKDRYVVMDNIMYIESSALNNQKLPYTFQVSKKELILNFKFDKQLLIQFYKLLELTDPEFAEILAPNISKIPDNYAGNIIIDLSR